MSDDDRLHQLHELLSQGLLSEQEHSAAVARLMHQPETAPAPQDGPDGRAASAPRASPERNEFRPATKAAIVAAVVLAAGGAGVAFTLAGHGGPTNTAVLAPSSSVPTTSAIFDPPTTTVDAAYVQRVAAAQALLAADRRLFKAFTDAGVLVGPDKTQYIVQAIRAEVLEIKQISVPPDVLPAINELINALDEEASAIGGSNQRAIGRALFRLNNAREQLAALLGGEGYQYRVLINYGGGGPPAGGVEVEVWLRCREGRLSDPRFESESSSGTRCGRMTGTILGRT